MKLVNETKNRIIAESVIFRESFLGCCIGLIPYKNVNRWIYDLFKFKKFGKRDAMIFKVRGNYGIHTWFMSFPISVFFLDKEGKVIEKISMKPFQTYKPKNKYESFIEMGSLAFNEIDIGDKVKVSEV